MTVRLKDQMSAPAINLEEMFVAYKNGVPLSAIGSRMAQIALLEGPVYDNSIFENYETMKKNLFIRVCGIEGNKEWLRRIPYKKIENLAITFHIMVNAGEEGMSSAAVTNNIMESYNLTTEQLYEDAMKNSPEILPAKVDTMANMLFGLTNVEMDSMGMPGQPPMVVVTNQMTKEKVILDTKWKRLSPKYQNYGISQADIYQMYVYHKKYQPKKVILLYPFVQSFESSDQIISYHAEEDIHVEISASFFDFLRVKESFEHIHQLMEI